MPVLHAAYVAGPKCCIWAACCGVHDHMVHGAAVKMLAWRTCDEDWVLISDLGYLCHSARNVSAAAAVGQTRCDDGCPAGAINPHTLEPFPDRLLHALQPLSLNNAPEKATTQHGKRGVLRRLDCLV